MDITKCHSETDYLGNSFGEMNVEHIKIIEFNNINYCFSCAEIYRFLNPGVNYLNQKLSTFYPGTFTELSTEHRRELEEFLHSNCTDLEFHPSLQFLEKEMSEIRNKVNLFRDIPSVTVIKGGRGGEGIFAEVGKYFAEKRFTTKDIENLKKLLEKIKIFDELLPSVENSCEQYDDINRIINNAKRELSRGVSSIETSNDIPDLNRFMSDIIGDIYDSYESMIHTYTDFDKSIKKGKMRNYNFTLDELFEQIINVKNKFGFR